jgi:hypothetical protein
MKLVVARRLWPWPMTLLLGPGPPSTRTTLYPGVPVSNMCIITNRQQDTARQPRSHRSPAPAALTSRTWHPLRPRYPDRHFTTAPDRRRVVVCQCHPSRFHSSKLSRVVPFSLPTLARFRPEVRLPFRKAAACMAAQPAPCFLMGDVIRRQSWNTAEGPGTRELMPTIHSDRPRADSCTIRPQTTRDPHRPINSLRAK